tara:strand:- start:820 stop:2817 length:1998 start_codon:yes stop_codon:yes gene_type:complete
MQNNNQFNTSQPFLMENESFNKVTHPANKERISTHIFAIDSRQRNYKLYPNPNNYNISIPDNYKNITSLELKAAMLPRTEYNVNSCNKYIDFAVGDHIKDIIIIDNKETIRNNLGNPINTTNNNITMSLEIDAPILTNSHITPIQATATIMIDSNSKIIPNSIIIQNSGSGYSYSQPPLIKIGNNTNFTAKIGFEITAELREGQYVIGGNPQFTSTDSRTNQSYTPNNLLNEIEAALTASILTSPYGNYTPKTALSYAFKRKSWADHYDTLSLSEASENDYPLFFCARLMSQYPNLESYNDFDENTSTNEAYETNSCKFNRIYISNILCLKINCTTPLPQTLTETSNIIYSLKQYFTINSTTFITFYELNNSVPPTTDNAWKGIDISTILDHPDNNNISSINFCHWEMLFATGQNNSINAATLLGFNKYDYNNCTNLGNPIQISHHSGSAPYTKNTLIPKGLTYSTENDYYLNGDPEYITLSFKPKYGSAGIGGINDRVDSHYDSNINRVFACLIFDSMKPSVLQDMSSGKKDCTMNSYNVLNNSLSTFKNSDYRSDAQNYPNENALPRHNNIHQLTGNSGNQNVSFLNTGGNLKAMKGSDFDRKIVKFPQPISQLSNINIKFTKFTKPEINNSNSDLELYNFAGKEHLLLFEIMCDDPMTGKKY